VYQTLEGEEVTLLKEVPEVFLDEGGISPPEVVVYMQGSVQVVPLPFLRSCYLVQPGISKLDRLWQMKPPPKRIKNDQ